MEAGSRADRTLGFPVDWEWIANQSGLRLPLSQIRYVILDLVADPVPGLHHRIFATIARWHSHARVHFHPEAFTHRRCNRGACATSFPPSALHQEGGPVFFVLRTRWWNDARKRRGGNTVFLPSVFFSRSFFRLFGSIDERGIGLSIVRGRQLWLNRSIVKDEWIWREYWSDSKLVDLLTRGFEKGWYE